MRKLMTTAGLAVVLLAGPAFAASDTQTSTTGADPARTGSAATEGSATGGGSDTASPSSDTSASSGTASDAQTGATGADPARTGSAATEGSATGGGSGAASPSSDTSASSGTASDSQTGTTGADPARTGSAATEGSATGGGSAELGTQSGAGAATTTRTFTTGELHGLIGQDVQNAGGEEIGEVKDVVMVDGRPMLVVGVGGFLGLGAKEVTLPYEEATMSSDGIQVSMTEDQLKQQPEYSADATAGVSIKDTYKQ